MKERFGDRVAPELIKGGSGVFEVHADGDLVFSKKASGRFPDDGEVEDLLAERLG